MVEFRDCLGEERKAKLVDWKEKTVIHFFIDIEYKERVLAGWSKYLFDFYLIRSPSSLQRLSIKSSWNDPKQSVIY